ncbi:aspartate carbamoyltransferase [Pseudoalteromonas sp. ACER1]|jgi:aspartate carbamoyltransferase catalytic subunit|uniref:Aspartate carbamoyltransferase n=3 Tax=Pseudoalteromonas TaxID=53246 RepID=A0A0P7D0T6_9GAMM|nr:MULTISPECIES: aspartate carbamoyltransferase [Pseudoalteromonas]MEC8207163.1 aspartate carbamoyltransferase [Pseudomonadota bacterium]KPM78136.1 aspartate carbamoyltransferase [Pseudoalteromonas sp. UCD-33C]KPM81731.1 aspartate carbamoyltransferase [Pseudoalteromonas lipolytica]KPZ74575.1 Aspartate carbamoyltransferase catalytic chain [Pseudoalteromonas sp. P1-26]KZY60070.1 aspartate carbamoyltransferase [Pseudoalteromonas shioyasakiensis]|tara:strand:- start:93 stop:1109 length:1017 start_codon:yes stop_codon:yes gene_type:complete
MLSFQGENILSVNQLDRDCIERIFAVAKKMEPYAKKQKRTNVLEGAILANLFFEPSTRTRVSFGTAFNLLGGLVRETTGMQSSALAKGESLYDTARVISAYADAVAMRHPDAGSVAEFATGCDVPVINGGDGPNEHPTQALLDLLTIERELGRFNQSIDGMHIALVGDLKYGRTVHSLSKLLCHYKDVKFSMVAPDGLQMPDYILDAVDNAGHKIQVVDKMEGNLAADIVYQTRIQEERFPSQEEANKYRGGFRISQAIYNAHCKPNSVLMHPLPRDSRLEANELDNDLNSNDNLAIFRQVQNGVLIRMALFALTLDVADKVEQYEVDVPWFSRKRNS